MGVDGPKGLQIREASTLCTWKLRKFDNLSSDFRISTRSAPAAL